MLCMQYIRHCIGMKGATYIYDDDIGSTCVRMSMRVRLWCMIRCVPMVMVTLSSISIDYGFSFDHGGASLWRGVTSRNTTTRVIRFDNCIKYTVYNN